MRKVDVDVVTVGVLVSVADSDRVSGADCVRLSVFVGGAETVGLFVLDCSIECVAEMVYECIDTEEITITKADCESVCVDVGEITAALA